MIGFPNTEPRLPSTRARSAMVITELAGVEKAPKFVFRTQVQLRKALWDVVWDRNRYVREHGVLGLQAILKTIITRGDPLHVEKIMDEIMATIRTTLSSNGSPTSDISPSPSHVPAKSYDSMAVIHGSLCMVASLLRSEEAVRFIRILLGELCTLSLRFQKSSNAEVREAVADILPLLVRLDHTVFEGDVLHQIHDSTLQLINDESFPAEERARSLLSLAEIAKQIPTHIQGPMLKDMLSVCRKSLAAHIPIPRADANTVPRLAALKTISRLARASGGNIVFEMAMRGGIISLMFSTEFTNTLVRAVDDVGHAVPSLAEFIRERLVNLIAATLRTTMQALNVGRANNPMFQRTKSTPLQSNSTEGVVIGRVSSMTNLNVSSGSGLSSSQDKLLPEKGIPPPVSADPLNFFKQPALSPELHRIDSGDVLTSYQSLCAIEGLIDTPIGSEASSPTSTEGISRMSVADSDVGADKDNSACVALKAIVTYEFTGMKAQDFSSFVNEFVIGYIEADNVKVRVLAVAASAKLMESAAVVSASADKTERMTRRLHPEIQSILSQLLLLIVGDPSTDVRYVALRSLGKKVFFPYLMQPEMLSALFLCFHDRCLPIRYSALSLAGQLSQYNPAHILPALRRYLTHLLTTMKFDGDYFERDRRDATKLIFALVHNSLSLIEPYTTSLMDALLIRLHEAKQINNSSSALPVLLAIAEMGGTMSRIDLKPYKAALVPLIVSSVLQVQSAKAEFRKAALRALASLVQNTGFVIKPYEDHPTLLPGLLELLRVETDAEVRMEAETLIGSLGAVDPDHHKYAALPMFLGGLITTTRNIGSGSHCRSILKMDNPSASNCGASTSNVYSQLRGGGAILSSQLHSGRLRYTQPTKESQVFDNARFRDSFDQGNVLYTDSRLGVFDIAATLEDANACISLFALGGATLGKIAGYTPVWEKEELENVSLVGQLEHPFTASPDYFPSVALDLLHTIIANPRLRMHYREACQAVVNILMSVGPKCAYFLPAVVPRLLWLLAQSSRLKSSPTLSFSKLQKQVMERLGNVITIARHNFLPYTFDTVLLAWFYLENMKSSPVCISSVCMLLTQLRRAIGDEFKPIIATVLPPLIAALSLDQTSNGSITKAVLRALESFSPLFEEYGITVLNSVVKVITTQNDSIIRQEALATLIHIIEDMSYVEVLSSVVHPLVQVLAGVGNNRPMPREAKVKQVNNDYQYSEARIYEDGKLPALAASALVKIGARSSREFNMFVPVITKALKFSSLKRNCESKEYRSLEKLLRDRDPDLVSELLGKPPNGVRSDRSHRPIHSSAEAFSNPSQEVVPARRGKIMGWTPLPVGTKTPTARVHVLEYILMQKWEVDHSFTTEDWVRWIGNLGATMFEQSGSAAFRGCVRFSECYPQFTKHLFNAAFLSCWTYPLSETAKAKICKSLEMAMSSETIPLNVLQALLNLYEYMDHDEKPLPSGTDHLARTACKCGAFAKAIRYREKEYSQHLGKPEKLVHDINGEEGLIAIYEKLGHIESAIGTISHYQSQTGEKVKEKWFEKLRRWDDALKVYEKEGSDIHEDISNSLYADKRKWENTLGRLRCLNEIGEWRMMNKLLQKARIACMGNVGPLQELALEGKGLSVALDLGRWEEYEEWVSYLEPDTYLGCFYKALLLIKQGKEDPSKLEDAESSLREARRKLDLDLTARVSEGYPRAYAHVVNAQILVELGEMISFLRMPREDSLSFGRHRLRKIWDQRLRGCKHDRYTWYRLLMIRALVMEPIENKEQWLDFATMCRKAKRLPMASEALRMLLNSVAENKPGRESGMANGVHGSRDFQSTLRFEEWDTDVIMSIEDLDIKFACVKHLWANNRRIEAYITLEKCQDKYLSAAGISPETDSLRWNVRPTAGISPETDSVRWNVRPIETKHLLAGEVFSKLAKWGQRLLDCDEVQGNSVIDPLVYAEKATRICPSWYKAWHYWALLNASRFEALLEREGFGSNTKNHGSRASILQASNGTMPLSSLQKKYISQAVRGYFRAINLSGKSRLEDSLKLLTLWFNFGGLENLNLEFDAGFGQTNIAMWLEVVPQIIARLYTPFEDVQRGVKSLLTKIGTEHPHVAVYPLTVAKGAYGNHQQKKSKAAREILEELKLHHEEIVEQAELVSNELVRVAVLWTDIWYESLEEASKLYFVNHNVKEMLETLLPLHETLEKGPETALEHNFMVEFGRELREAGELCKKFHMEHHRGVVDDVTLRKYLLQAWTLYHHVFRKLQRQQQSMHVLDLAYVSRGLNEVVGFKLAVPGTYNPDEGVPVVGIQSFNQQMTVMQSKQKPRRLSMTGSNGREYQFLLKGHEDLRQDERVMQVFGLINKLFTKSDQRAILNGVGLKTYAVIALSSNAGLIEWVPDCDTMHALVKEYREVRKIMPNIEHRVMLRIAPEPDRLPLLHKVDLFEFMLQNTGGVDISNVLWLKSRNSEMWLDRRTMYAKSLATTSMTGYLLGLGDRHPSNLMIDRLTGKIMHVDFGDCFEVAMKREKYPEKVPFRLTRMLVEALEPCGVDGYFRHTSEATLDVLRQMNARESLMSMMEAFVHDPLIRYKLIGADEWVRIRGGVAGSQQNDASVLNEGQESRSARQSLRAVMAESELQSDAIRSLQETGSLSASLQQLAVGRSAPEEENTDENIPGAIPTPSASISNQPVQQEDDDPATWKTSKGSGVMNQRRMAGEGDPAQRRLTDVANQRAQNALNRFADKLCGRDFDPNKTLPVADQVSLLIRDAQNIENLCALFLGWCAFW